jgi:cell wall-associated NlpC family hydrolase
MAASSSFPTPDVLERAARRWRGTPCRPHCAKPGPRGGVDCLNLVGAILADVGLIPAWVNSGLPEYTLDWANHNRIDTLTPGLRAYLPGWMKIQDPGANFQPCDVVVFRIGHVPYHLGLMLSPTEMIHCLRPAGVARAYTSHKLFAKHLDSVYRAPPPASNLTPQASPLPPHPSRLTPPA